MKKIIISGLLALGLVGVAQAAGGGIPWDKAPKSVSDVAAVQHGAKLFMNYCMNCHSASFVRYNRLQDIGLTEQDIKDNLLFVNGTKVGDTMTAAINPKEAKEWFGATPPDLTLVARSRAAIGKGTGADYLYTYLRSYYPDDTKATGWNNLAFPSVGMPHVLWELQGTREPQFEHVKDAHGHEAAIFKGWKQLTPGTMTPQEYDDAVADLVAYMQWMAEPAQEDRKGLGVWVMFYLLIFAFCAWRLNAAYWKDVK